MEDSQPPTLAYAFAHIYFRDLILSKDPQFQAIFQQGPTVLNAFLSAAWNALGQANPDFVQPAQVTADEFHPMLLRVNETQTLLTIEFPKPLSMTEAYMVGIVLGEQPRYFTVEKGITQTGADFAVVCEWQGTEHKQFGTISEPVPEKFGGRIDALLKEESNARTLSKS